MDVPSCWVTLAFAERKMGDGVGGSGLNNHQYDFILRNADGDLIYVEVKNWSKSGKNGEKTADDFVDKLMNDTSLVKGEEGFEPAKQMG